MANALQFIESNIEDLDKEEVQLEIARKFVQKCKAEKDQYTEIGKLESLYNSALTDNQHLSFEQMRLIEEILWYGDDAVVHSPNELRDDAISRLEKGVKLYG